MSALVAFICRNPKHRGHAEHISKPITINDGEWAFCPTGAADQHAWERTPATTLYALRHTAVREERVRA
jgi:hypothetical protein